MIVAEAADALRRLGPVRYAIELGAGTGQFTGLVAEIAGHVTAIDSSREALALNASKVQVPNVERVVANVFEWLPSAPADLVVLAFLLSHVPTARLRAFWDTIGRMLTPGGRVFLIDESSHGEWHEEPAGDPDGEIVYRTVSDGRRFRVVKVLWDLDELAERLLDAGWDATLVRKDPFYWGSVIWADLGHAAVQHGRSRS